MEFIQLNKDLNVEKLGPWALEARNIANSELIPHADQWDQQASYPKDTIDALAKRGFLTLMLNEASGGAGLTLSEYVDVIREISIGCASISVTVGVSNMVATVINNHAKAKLHGNFLRANLDKKPWLLSFAISEPDAGSDAANIQTTYEIKGDKIVIHGHKCFISTALNADGLLTSARELNAYKNGNAKISSIYVPRNHDKLRVGKTEKKMGLLASNTSQVFYDHVEVPIDNLLGDEGSGFQINMAALNSGRVGIAAQAIGIAQACLKIAAPWVRRHANEQSRRWQIADMVTELEAGLQLIAYAAQSANRPADFPYAASRAKLFCTEVANKIVGYALEIMGKEAYGGTSSAARHFRDCRVTTLYEGTSEIQRLLIARGLIKFAEGL